MVCPLINHITLGRGKPVTRQQNRDQSPSSTVTGSGLLTNIGAQRDLAASSGSSGTLYIRKLLIIFIMGKNKYYKILQLTLAKQLPFLESFQYSSYLSVIEIHK